MSLEQLSSESDEDVSYSQTYTQMKSSLDINDAVLQYERKNSLDIIDNTVTNSSYRFTNFKELELRTDTSMKKSEKRKGSLSKDLVEELAL